MTFSWAVAGSLAASAGVASLGPIALGVILARRTGVSVRPWLVGALTFFVSQCVLRLPWQIPLGLWMSKRSEGHVAAQYAWLFASAFTAGLFEEVGRYVGIRTLLKKERSFRVGLMMGAGHGGIEAMLLVGLTLGITTVLYVAMGHGIEVAPKAHAQLDKAFSGLTVTGALAGGVERILAMCIHLSQSVLVMEGFIRKQRRWLPIAIGLHFAVDGLGVAAALWMNKHFHSPLLAEVAILPFALFALWIVVHFWCRSARLVH